MVITATSDSKIPIITTVPKVMGRIEDRFSKLEHIGSGAYGTVFRAIDRRDNNIVALKRIKLNNHETEEDGVPSSSLREIGLLKDLKHPNVLRLLDVQTCENNLFLVFEHLDLDLKKLLDHHKNGLKKATVKSYLWQLLQGLSYCHARRILHRDLKLQNLLVDRFGNIKLADFGLARSICFPVRTYTHEVVTLWYRSPELLLKAIHYGPSVDLWSLGCIFAEMLTNKILFPGDSEIDQLYRIFRTLGTPTESIWPGFEQMPEYRSFSKFKGRGIKNYIGDDDLLAIDLMEKFLTYDPSSRISAIQALEHPYLQDATKIETTSLKTL